MPEEPFPQPGKRTTESPAMVLQIDRPGGEAPLQFPAVIRNLLAGVVTLEVKNPWTILKWDTLKGQVSCLRLLSGNGDITDLRGTITWAKYTVQGPNNGNLSLSLKLNDPDPLTQKLLSASISHTSEDIKGLWEKWDQAQNKTGSSRLSVQPAKIGLTALVLLLAGLALQLSEAQGFKLLGWVLWFFGTVVVALQALQFWKSRKASQ